MTTTTSRSYCIFYALGYVLVDRDPIMVTPKSESIRRNILRIAHPTSNALVFYATNDTCVQQQCGSDIFLIEYIAAKLNKEIV